MVRKNFNWMYAAILSFCGMVSLTSCGDSDEGLVQLQSPEESYGSEFVGNWATDNSDGNKGYEGYGIYADGRFEYYTVAFSEEGNGEMKVDSLSGTWTPLMSIPNKWDSQATEPLKGVEVQFAAQAEDGTQLTDTLIMEKMDDDYTLMWASELNRIAESLASSETATTRGWGSFWSSVKNVYNNVVNTIKKIAYPASNYLTWRINGESQKIVSGYADWMRDIYGDVNPKICEMSIPGTHDSFTYNYSGLVSLVTARGVKTQGLDIAHQWAAGVRSFDVRMNRRGSTLGMYHGPFYLGLSLSQALNEIRNQLKAHPKEMAIVFLQFEECSATDEYCKMVYDIVQQLKREGYVANPKADMRLNDCRGKMIFVQRYYTSKYKVGARRYGDSTLYFYNDNGGCIGSTGFNFCDIYTNKDGESASSFYSRKQASMTRAFEKAANASSSQNLWTSNGASGYYASISTAYITYACNNPSEVAHVMNPWVKKYLDGHKGKKTGIVSLDFAGTNYCPYGYTTLGHDVMKSIIDNNVDLRNNKVISLE